MGASSSTGTRQAAERNNGFFRPGRAPSPSAARNWYTRPLEGGGPAPLVPGAPHPQFRAPPPVEPVSFKIDPAPAHLPSATANVSADAPLASKKDPFGMLSTGT